MKLIFLGTSAGYATKKRCNTSILLTVKDNYYLIDAGEPCSATMIKRKINQHKIKAVFISHLHADHCAGIPMLIQYLQLTNRRNPLKLFIPQEGLNRMKSVFEMHYLMDEVLPFKLCMKNTQTGVFYKDENIRISAFPTTHLEGFKNIVKENYMENKMEAYCLVIECEGKRILYSGDIKNASDDLGKHLQDIDLLILELAHIKPEETFKYLASKKVENVIVTHLVYMTKSNTEKFKTRTDKGYMNTTEREMMTLGKKYFNKFKIATDNLNILL